jgi:glycogen debranching enzyme
MNLEPVDTASAELTAAQFYIPATSSFHERSLRTLKHNDTFAVFDQSGFMVAGPGRPEGLYHCDTRYLSGFELILNECRPMLLSSILRDDNVMLTCDLTNPDIFSRGELVLPRDEIHIGCSKFLWAGVCFQRILLRNFGSQAHRLALEISLAADFADIFEVRGSRRERRGREHKPEIEFGTLSFRYTGLDGVLRVTRVRFDPTPQRLEPGKAFFEVELAPKRRMIVFIEIRCDPAVPRLRAGDNFLASVAESRRASRNSAARSTSIVTANDIFNEAIGRSIADLKMLLTDKPTGPFPYAGIPWFSAPFGRDALITAYQTLWIDPTVARGTLAFLAAHQARIADPNADAEPGKILHEVRGGEMAALGEVPFKKYYGSVDSTPLFVALAGAYLERTNDVETIARIWPNIEAALQWIDHHGDCDGDGFVEYRGHLSNGLVNQGWKDSQDAVWHADGSLAARPIALSEVQGYVYLAKQGAAAIATILGHKDQARVLADEAELLKRRFDAAFWCEELGLYALALDAEKRPCLVRSSNAGQTLFTGIAEERRISRIVPALMDSTLYSGWGIRTVGSTEARYNPMSYHNGSVWPHDNALIALGLARYGYKAEAAKIFSCLFHASIYMDLRRLPELFCGFARRQGRGPTLYPVACSPQAWASAAFLSLLQACLGLQFQPRDRTVLLERPVLPDFLDYVVVRNLAVAGGLIDFVVRRTDGQVATNILGRSGELRLLTRS